MSHSASCGILAIVEAAKKTNNVPGRKISAPPTIPSNRIRKEPVNEREVTNAAKLKKGSGNSWI